MQSSGRRSGRSGRASSFPKAEKRAYLYSPDELRAIYDRLPTYEAPFVRFAVHTGMRLREITTLNWGNVNLEQRTAYVEARFAKNGRARDVVLGESRSRSRSSPVSGRRILRPPTTSFSAGVARPYATSGEASIRPSSRSGSRPGLGHADENVTDTYILPSLEAVRDAVNRAARSIDGEIPAGALPFPSNTARQVAQQSEESATSSR